MILRSVSVWLTALGAVLVFGVSGTLAATATANADRDSATTILPGLVVSGAEAELPGPDETRIEAAAIALRDPGSLADIGGLIPSARVSTNSRGDAHLMIRGAPERHVQAFLDGIPLNLPWDERVDLQTIPITGIGRLSGTRGLTTLLDGPGVLAGSVHLLAPDFDADQKRNHVGLAAGDFGRGRTDLRHHNRYGPWAVLGALGWQGHDALILPTGVSENGDPTRRHNSDLSQYSGLLRASRAVGGVGRLSLLATAWTAEKGVPAELHLGDEARFWRYPVRERALFGASLDLPLNAAGTWDLATVVSADLFHQEIDPRGPDLWPTEPVTGQDYEENRDRTGFAKIRATHWLGQATRIALQTTARYTRHQETLTVGGAEATYSQWLNSAVAELEFHPQATWQLRLGAGVDQHATPETGPQPANGSASHPAWNARLTHPLARDAQIFVAASQRSRAPSLRELYSGALGRFVPNPALKPERQDLLEIGYARDTARWRLEAAAFLLHLRDGIERISLNNPARQYQRVNRTEIRVPGLELAAGWRWRSDLDFSLQHTILAARVNDGGSFSLPAEDRPDYLSRLGVNWRPATGPGAALEVAVTGARWSTDTTLPAGRRRLPAGAVWNARAGWRLAPSARDVELSVRLDNVFDQRVDDQVGLPNAGRTFSGAVSLDF